MSATLSQISFFLSSSLCTRDTFSTPFHSPRSAFDHNGFSGIHWLPPRGPSRTHFAKEQPRRDWCSQGLGIRSQCSDRHQGESSDHREHAQSFWATKTNFKRSDCNKSSLLLDGSDSPSLTALIWSMALKIWSASLSQLSSPFWMKWRTWLIVMSRKHPTSWRRSDVLQSTGVHRKPFFLTIFTPLLAWSRESGPSTGKRKVSHILFKVSCLLQPLFFRIFPTLYASASCTRREWCSTEKRKELSWGSSQTFTLVCFCVCPSCTSSALTTLPPLPGESGISTGERSVSHPLILSSSRLC